MSSRASDSCCWRMPNETWDGENATICSYRNLQVNNRVVSPPSRIVGQEECNRANNSLMVRQTERHTLCRVTLQDKPHSSIFDSYSFAQPCNFDPKWKKRGRSRSGGLAAAHGQRGHHNSPGSHPQETVTFPGTAEHPKAPDNEGLPIPEGITMGRYATAR